MLSPLVGDRRFRYSLVQVRSKLKVNSEGISVRLCRIRSRRSEIGSGESHGCPTWASSEFVRRLEHTISHYSVSLSEEIVYTWLALGDEHSFLNRGGEFDAPEAMNATDNRNLFEARDMDT